MGQLDGKIAAITGGASGIGLACVERFVAEGARVCVGDVNQAALDQVQERLGDKVAVSAGDVTVEDDVARFVQTAVDSFGRLDVVVPNAGVQHVAPVHEFPEERWESIVALLLTSPFLLAKHAWPALRDSPSGRFIVIASVHGLVASPYKAAYVSAKHGVLGLVKTLALEGADEGISAVAVCPGYVRTPLVEKQIADQARVHQLSEDQVLEQVILAPHAVKELIEPAEVAEVVAFLAGPSGRAFTGVPVTMDQGWSAR